jgi:toxin ParE1/3/4
MRRLRYSKAANQDFIDIARFIQRSNGSQTTAIAFIAALRRQCRRLAELPGSLGRSRADIRPDARSFAYRNYVLVFRYQGEAVEILRVIERHRDIGAQFNEDAD